GNYSAGAAGYAEAMGDLVKVFTVIGAMQAAIAANPTAPAWPATSKVPDALKAVPSRSALVLIALMSGVPMQSAHFDSTSAPAGLPASNALSFQLAINPALAALENLANAAALAVLATHDVELQAGGAIFDNTATDYSARLFTGTADPVTTPGNQQAVIDKYAAYSAEKWAAAKKEGIRTRPANNLLVLWNFPPEKYTKFTAAGSPNTTVAAATGTNHCNFTVSQYLAIADLLAYAAGNGKNMSGGALYTKIRKAGSMTYDRGYSAPKLKYYGE
ncbi:MAG: hypothetical protein EBZ79_03030, partial [Actinobacteria bacterium]|nr:hypothetical protein [Actinomycetota bacterium]